MKTLDEGIVNYEKRRKIAIDLINWETIIFLQTV